MQKFWKICDKNGKVKGYFMIVHRDERNIHLDCSTTVIPQIMLKKIQLWFEDTAIKLGYLVNMWMSEPTKKDSSQKKVINLFSKLRPYIWNRENVRTARSFRLEKNLNYYLIIIFSEGKSIFYKVHLWIVLFTVQSLGTIVIFCSKCLNLKKKKKVCFRNCLVL